MNDNFIFALQMIIIFIVGMGFYGLFIISYDQDELQNQHNETTNNTKIMVDESMAELNEKIKAAETTDVMTDDEYNTMIEGLYKDLENINKNLDILIKICKDDGDCD